MMKIRIASVFLTIALLGALLFPASAESLYDLPQDKTLTAASAMVVHLGLTPEQDIVLYEKDPDVVRAPAALVRLMEAAYALTILEEKNMDMNTATGTYELWMFNQFVAGTGINPVGMEFGETWTIKDLLVASTISTASDAAVTLAAALSETGKVGDFVDGMNRLAKEIGCTHTSFANVTGLDALTQYTTARDMYKIIRYAMDFRPSSRSSAPSIIPSARFPAAPKAIWLSTATPCSNRRAAITIPRWSSGAPGSPTWRAGASPPSRGTAGTTTW